MDFKKEIPSESIGQLAKKQQPHSLRGASKKKKFEIPKEELKDGDFDQIVQETSASVTRNLKAALQPIKLEPKNHDKDADQPLGVGSQPLEQDSSSQTSELSLGHCNDNRFDVSQPKRPMNAFMVWGQAIRRELHNKFSNVQNAVLSKALGRVWKRLDLEEKEPYITRANIIKTNHKRDYPNYRYQPRRIQEKQRRAQQNDHQQHLKRQQRVRPAPLGSVIQRPSREASIITSASQISYDNSVANHQSSNVFVIHDDNNAGLMAGIKREEGYEDELWKAASNYATWDAENGYNNGAGGLLLGQGFSQARKQLDNDDKYFRYENHQGEQQLVVEYNLPPIDPEANNMNHNHTNDIQNQVVSVDDDHHQARLFYEVTNEHLGKGSDIAVIQQTALNNLCMDSQHHGQQSVGQGISSVDSYNSNYQQQYQPRELTQELSQQVQANHHHQQPHNDLGGFGQFQQADSEQVRYQEANVRYHQHNPDHHDQNQQQHLYLRQINEFAHSTNHGSYRFHAQTENYHNCRSYPDEVCLV